MNTGRAVVFCLGWLSLAPAMAQFITGVGLLHTEGARDYWVGPSTYYVTLVLSALLPYFVASIVPACAIGLLVGRYAFLSRLPILTVAAGSAVTGILTWVIAKTTHLSFDHIWFLLQRGAQGAVFPWVSSSLLVYVVVHVIRRVPRLLRFLRTRLATAVHLAILISLYTCSGDTPHTSSNSPVAATPTELQRLRAALESDGPEREAVAGRIRDADRAIANPIDFPPRGGQHNQWYQCETHQIALKNREDAHTCPIDGETFSGYPVDDAAFSRVHSRNLGRAYHAAWAYALTEDPKYSSYTKAVLLGYAERYLTYPYHANTENDLIMAGMMGGHLEEQTLDEAWLLAKRIGPAYDLIRQSLTDEERGRIERDLIRPMLETIGKFRFGRSNWQSWHNAGMIVGGLLVDAPDYVERALHDPYNGFAFQLEHCVTDEGMWYENSWGYHFYTLDALATLAETARRSGTGGWTHPVLARMLLLPTKYAMPDGTLPRFGDDVSTRLSGRAPLFEAAYSALGDPALRVGTSRSPTWHSVLHGRDITHDETIALGSEALDGAGHAILRDAGAKGLTTVLTYGQPGGFHGHFDKLSFVFFGLGKELGVDPGRAKSQAYRLPIHQNWYRATTSHNTVVVDGKSQAPAGGGLIHFGTTDGHTVAAARCSTAYPDVTQDRLIYQSEHYLLVIDKMTSPTEHTYDWVYHSVGTSQSNMTMTPTDLTDLQGASFIQNARRSEPTGMAHIKFVDTDVTTAVTVTSDDAFTAFAGDGPFGSVDQLAPMMLARRSARSALFAATLEPAEVGEAYVIKAVTVRSDGDAVWVAVNTETGEDQISWDQEEVRIRRSGTDVFVVRGRAK